MSSSVELPELELRGDLASRHAPPDFELEEGRAPAAGAAPWPVARPCSREYTAVRQSGRRRLSLIDWLVIHCTQGSTARGAASWFENPKAGGSANLVVDSLECFRTLPASIIPWGAIGANLHGWHIEFAGFAEWSRAEWLERDRMLSRGAYKLAVHSKLFGVPLRVRRPSEARAGRPGVITHRTAARAFGGSHWDPGSGFPLDVVMRRARRYREKL